MASSHRIVSREGWLEARKALLIKEKEFTRLRDQLSQARREMPWERVGQQYVFAGPEGNQTLGELFDGRSQLVVYHFMFEPDWAAGCHGCSFWADNFDHIPVHLAHRDISFVAISRAPFAKLEAYRKRMGWSFRWRSSFGSDFNYDYFVSFTPEQVANASACWNYQRKTPHGEDVAGISVFARDDIGAIFHTYSTYMRGLDMLNLAYHYIDLTPKGRDQGGHGFPMFWVRRHDEYER